MPEVLVAETCSEFKRSCTVKVPALSERARGWGMPCRMLLTRPLDACLLLIRFLQFSIMKSTCGVVEARVLSWCRIPCKVVESGDVLWEMCDILT